MVWDDWGGWYDALPSNTNDPLTDPFGNIYVPGNKDPYEFGYRVPLIVVSPFVLQNPNGSPGANALVDSFQRSDAGILRFIEGTFLGLTHEGSLHTLDTQGDDLYTHLVQSTENPNALPTPANISQNGFPTDNNGANLPQCIPVTPPSEISD